MDGGVSIFTRAPALWSAALTFSPFRCFVVSYFRTFVVSHVCCLVLCWCVLSLFRTLMWWLALPSVTPVFTVQQSPWCYAARHAGVLVNMVNTAVHHAGAPVKWLALPSITPGPDDDVNAAVHHAGAPVKWLALPSVTPGPDEDVNAAVHHTGPRWSG